MASAAQPEAQNGAAVGLAQIAENPKCPETEEKCLVPAHDKCPAGHSSEPELQEEAPKPGEEGLNPEVEAGEEREPRPTASTVRPRHGPKRKPIKEEPEGSHSESSLSAKQHKKAKKRKSVGAPVLPAVVSTASPGAPAFALSRFLAGKAQRLRPLYQYINYRNPELNQAGEEDRETEVVPESELALVPEEAGVEQMQTLLPMAGELGLGLALPCSNATVPLTHTIAPPLGEEVGEESGGLSSLRVSGSLKAEVDTTTQVDINKMLSVCAAPLVPPLSPQYK
uniref:RIKEN cDNA 4933405L10 gene n=1 Tax=Nannospalax galili TaxID=1026970 RepID=A0A8C6R7Q4_NANGA